MEQQHVHKRTRVDATAQDSSSPPAGLSLDPDRYLHVSLPPLGSSSFSASSSSVPCPHPPPLPLHLWGLDPLFFSCVKLLIGHVLRLPAFPDLPSSVSLLGHPVHKVEVLGVIVAREVKEKFSAYSVDDSSGVIKVKVWHSSDADTRPPLVYAGGILSERHEALQLGQTLRCMGRLQWYNGEREINAESIRLEEDDECAELLHWAECLSLYDAVYSQPSAIARRHHSEWQQRRAKHQMDVLT